MDRLLTKARGYGEVIGMVMHGLNSSEFEESEVKCAAVFDSYDNRRIPLYRMVADFCADCFERAGEKRAFEYHLFTKLASADPWHSSFDRWVLPAVRVLGDFAAEQADQTEKAAAEKRSGTLANMMGLAGGAKELLHWLLLGGAVGGGITGAGAWLLDRQVREDEAEGEALKAQTEYYKRLTGALKRELSQDPTLLQDEDRLGFVANREAQDLKAHERQFNEQRTREEQSRMDMPMMA